MDFLQKLDFLMDKYNLNKRTLALNSGIPYTTIDNWYKRGYDGMKISTLRILSDYFNTVLDFWIQDDISDPNYWKNQTLAKNSPDTAEAAPGEDHIIALYRKLNHEGQEKLIDYADDLVASGKYIKSDPAGLGKEA